MNRIPDCIVFMIAAMCNRTGSCDKYDAHLCINGSRLYFFDVFIHFIAGDFYWNRVHRIHVCEFDQYEQ